MKPDQSELDVDAFNLAPEVAIDGERVARERREQAARDKEAAEYQAKFQLTLAECPGVVGFDAPRGPAAVGKVVIEPAFVMEAMQWLKRRFRVNESLELSTDTGLCVEITPRPRKANRHPYMRVSFNKPQQFELPL